MTNEEFQKIVLEKFSSVEGQLSRVEAQLTKVKGQLDEHTQILQALIHSSEVNTAERDKMANDIRHIRGEITGLRKDIAQVEIVTASNWNEIAKIKAVKL